MVGGGVVIVVLVVIYSIFCQPGNVLVNGGSTDNLPFLLARQNENKDVILFVGSPLKDGLLIAGNVQVTLQVSSSLAYSDFYTKLLDYDSHKK